MAEIVLRVRLMGGEHLDVTYDDDEDSRRRSWSASPRPRGP